MAKQTFSASVDSWVSKSKRRALVVFQQSAQDVVTIMQTPVGAGGNMPVDTGFLRASLTAQINTIPGGYKAKEKTEPGSYDSEASAAEAQYTLVINRAKLGDSIYAVYLANYAIHQEYGTEHMAGKGFVRNAALQWQRIVDDNVRKARAIQ